MFGLHFLHSSISQSSLFTIVCLTVYSNENLISFMVFLHSLLLDSTKLVLWNESLPCCDWNGVTCHEEGHVTCLDLSEEYITGGLDNSSTLFNLQHLQKLNLAHNYFNSKIPHEIVKMKNLTYLNLSNAGFIKQIPIEIGQLTRLVTLDISALYYEEFNLALEIPNLGKLVQNLTEIRELYLDGTAISLEGKEWGQALSSSLPHLQVLSMSSCNLSGPIDSSLESLKNLSIIDLNQNNLSAPVPKFFTNFSNLTFLDLSNCGLNGRFPEEIFRVKSLSFLLLYCNYDLEGSLPSFPQKVSLQTLLLSSTSFSGALPSSISNLRQLSKLEISNCQFNGPLPDSMSNLTELARLDLSFNQFQGSIPPFGMAKKLILLDLSHNNLSGGISSAHFKGLENLVTLDFRNNLLSGCIPSSLFMLPLLKSVDLSNNNFEGQLNGIANASSFMLEALDLSSNKLEGPIPEFIFHLRRLNLLQLSSNKFNGTMQLDMILRLENLTTLDLSHNNLAINFSAKDAHLSTFPGMITNVLLASCKLRGFPSFLRNQSRLFHLDLSNNQISGTIPNWIWQLGSLGQLNLSHNLLMKIERPLHHASIRLAIVDLHDNNLQGSLPEFPKYASYLDYSNNNFSSVIPPDIGNCLSFTIFLSFSNNSLHGKIPDSICKASYLQVLDLSFNNFDEMIPHCLAKCKILGVLNLGNNNLGGIIPDTFQASCALETLDLSSNNIKGPIPRSLSSCTKLEVLDLGNNKIEDKFPCFLKNVSILRVMVLRNNNFHGPIGCPEIKTNWGKLQIVDLAFNKFNGTLPGNFFSTWKEMMLNEDQTALERNHLSFELIASVYYQDQVTVSWKGHQITLKKILMVFTSIDFSSNKIEGQIPEQMMDFIALIGLNLSNNALSGPIPSSMEKLKVLESLDLSSNSFTGEIPQQLANLNFLSFLNLSFNHLEGQIPKGTQLQSFDAASFAGNVGLCGLPSLTKCSELIHSSEVTHHMDSRFEFEWLFVLPGVVFGLGIIIGPLFYKKAWRIWYWKLVDNILCSIFPQLYHDFQTHEGQVYAVLRWSR